MVLHRLETLLHAFADSDGRDDHDELTPTVSLIQFKHGLDVDIGLAGPCFHFYVKRAGPHRFYQLVRRGNIIVALNGLDIF